MSKRNSYKLLLKVDLFTIGLGVILLVADAYNIGKLDGAAKDDPSRSDADSAVEASAPEPDQESGE